MSTLSGRMETQQNRKRIAAVSELSFCKIKFLFDEQEACFIAGRFV